MRRLPLCVDSIGGHPSLIFCPYKAFTAPGGKYGWDVPSSGTFFTYNLGKAILLKGVEKTVGVGRRDL